MPLICPDRNPKPLNVITAILKVSFCIKQQFTEIGYWAVLSLKSK